MWMDFLPYIMNFLFGQKRLNFMNSNITRYVKSLITRGRYYNALKFFFLVFLMHAYCRRPPKSNGSDLLGIESNNSI